MQIDRISAMYQLRNHVYPRTLEQYKNQPQFKTASPMLYANDAQIVSKAEALITKLSYYLQSVEPVPKLFFKKGDTVPVPDIHGDFVHLIITLYRHGLLDSNLDLKKDFKYVFLGDFYNFGKDANVVDYWLNKQINNEVTIHRLAGNHELFFLLRDEEGKFRVKLRNTETGERYPMPAFDVDSDLENGFPVAEELLKSIKEGNLLAAYTALDEENNVPVLYTHTFTTSVDFERLGIDKQDLVGFVERTNEKFRAVGTESHEIFMDGKESGKIDWKAVTKPIFDEPIFNILHKDENKRSDAFFVRLTGLTSNFDVVSNISDEIPEGVFQVVGHIQIPDFDLPKDYPTNEPLILAGIGNKAFVQFTDIGMGMHYDEENLERPNVSIKVA